MIFKHSLMYDVIMDANTNIFKVYEYFSLYSLLFTPEDAEMRGKLSFCH